MPLNLTSLLPGLVMLTLLGAIAIHDMRHQRIPDALNASLAIAGILFSFSGHGLPPQQAFAGAMLGLAITGLVRVAYHRARGRHGLGLGDVKMVTACGFWLGPQGVGIMLLVAALTAIAWSIVRQWTAASRPSRKTILPFGPWLALGAVVAFSCA